MSQLVQERWDRKLQNWALWLVSGGVSGKSSPYPAYRDHVPSRRWWMASPMPQPMVGDALDTEALICKLAAEGRTGAEQFEALRAWYVWSGNLADRAAVLKIHPDTLTDRVTAARYRLNDLEGLRRRDAFKPPGNMLACA